MVYTEIKEVTDVFVRAVISKLPRFKINCFAQEFSNDLLQAFFSENNENNKDLLSEL
jgi:hypothetical protein